MHEAKLPARVIRLFIMVTALLPTGCSKKLTVDPTYSPEGTPSPDAKLIVYRDAGILVSAKHEFPPNSGLYQLDSTFTAYNNGPGTVLGVVIDGTNASGYEMMRRTTSGGFAPIKDFMLTPANRWLYSHWEAYPFHDDSTAGLLPPTYEGRGVVAGQVTASAPLTNKAVLEAPNLADCRVLRPIIDTVPHDSLPTVVWQAVPGAANYYLHIYQFRGDIRVGSEKYVFGTPAPVALGKIRDFFIAILPGTTTAYKLGGPGAQILLNTPMIGPARFFFRISAVDSLGQLIGCTVGSAPDTVRIGTEVFIYRSSAEVVCIGCHSGI